jgi:glycosyltransferase involved in cell wall biosynthesis
VKRKRSRIVARRSRGTPITEFALVGIVGTWMEADIIEATVANARRQGCDSVYLLDDGSPDDTVARAEAAGAIVADTTKSERWMTREMRNRRRELVDRLATASGEQHIWFLHLDADELPQGPGGRTVREYLATLDRSTRVVGSRFLNHLPTQRPANLRGFHPGECQPLVYERTGHACGAGHFKHQLLRFDRDGPPLLVGYGAHRPSGPRRVFEALEPVVVHHFQFRDEAVTRRRMQALATRMIDADGHQMRSNRSAWGRFEDLDHVYRGEWDHVRNDGTREMGVADVLGTADELLAPEDARLPTWYSADELAAARDAAR